MNMNERVYYSNEAARRAMMQRNIFALITAGLGLAIGVVIALMLAPQTGERTRRLFGQQVHDIVSTGLETAQSGLDQVGNVANTVREKVEDRINHS